MGTMNLFVIIVSIVSIIAFDNYENDRLIPNYDSFHSKMSQVQKKNNKDGQKGEGFHTDNFKSFQSNRDGNSMLIDKSRTNSKGILVEKKKGAKEASTIKKRIKQKAQHTFGDSTSFDNDHLQRNILEESDSEYNDVCRTFIEFDYLLEYPRREDRRDMFNCSDRCLCKYLERHYIIANCGDKKLHSIPSDLPRKTRTLEISYNNLSQLHLSTIFSYNDLKTLHATDCNIITIRHVTTGSSHLAELLDLRYNRIGSLSGAVFSGFINLRVLLLTGNLIQFVQRDFFFGLDNLHFLDLSLNKMKKIDDASFDNLYKLEMLSITGNYHLGYNNFSPLLFKNLKKLKSLKIQGSSNGATKYPNKAIGELTNLQELNIDALMHPAEFGPELQNLNSLKILRFGPYADCRLVNMSQSFFQYFPNLICLYYHTCNILRFNPNAYASLPKLEALTIQNIPSMKLDDAFEHLSGFQTTSLKYVGFVNLTNWMWPCIWLTSDQGKHLSRFNLTTINLSDNRLSLLSDSFLKSIPKTIEKLILRNNKLTLINTLWTTLVNFIKLTYIDVSIQNMESRDRYFPLFVHRDNPYQGSASRGSKLSNNDLREYQEESQFNLHDKHWPIHPTLKLAKRSTANIENEFIYIPVNLKTVKASWYNFYGGVLLSNAIGNNSLHELNFSRSALHFWGKGKLPKGVKVVDLSGNGCRWISNDFFQVNNSLTDLHIQVNFLGEFISSSDGSAMMHLNNLKYLDLSTNAVFHIPFHFFNGLDQVQTIKLENNRLETLNVSFENTPALNFLDLQRNSLSYIAETTRNNLDKLALRPTGMVLDLHYNPLLCTCDYIDMLRWMATTNVYLLNMPLYECRDIHDKLISINSREQMSQIVYSLRRHCYSYGYLLFGIVAFSLIFIITTTTGVLYRYRWWVRYKKQVLFARWFGFKPYNGRDDISLDYKYDACLLYTSKDRQFAFKCSKELEKNRKHRLCIGDRDILPGTNELSAIVNVVQNSRVTLLAITDEFALEMGNYFRENPKLDYAIQMALMEEYCTKRKVLHLLLSTNYKYVKYPPYLLKVFHDDSVTQFPSQDDDEVTSDMLTTFWDNLSNTIGHRRQCVTDEQEDDYSLYFNYYSNEDIE